MVFALPIFGLALLLELVVRAPLRNLICENGVVMNFGFIPWPEIADFELSADRRVLTLRETRRTLGARETYRLFLSESPPELEATVRQRVPHID